MFDIFPRALASVASVLFPIFASYKALQTADPAQLTPWLMYWVVLACITLVESWTGWLLVWIPFYHYFRLIGMLYLVLPQTQGARVLYQTQVHPWLQHHESRIDDFIGSAHDRLRSAGMAYLRQAIAYVRAALGLPEAVVPSAASSSPSPPTTSPSSYTQALLSRFSLPSARWPGGATVPDEATAAAAAAASPAGLYSLFSGAIDRALHATVEPGAGIPATDGQRDVLRDRLRSLLTALERTETDDASELRKSRSEPDFERIDAESGAEDEGGHGRAPGLRKRTVPAAEQNPTSGGGSWMSWGWGAGAGGPEETGTSSATYK
ncbi:hva22 domain protein membrane protein [Grosmannia clavigera kw1407]|uniref:Protein YOP1 n=1 Tax=Grosmannia clavigera (strain kw1407 / UAMH 11150) TaxID=655863 RepID=F0XQG9_GROCL|nr:hva22 domain protein membrane protein [Grosmannia clavigera kw1407]EFX00077.1 hva22 domain protein membrane protein [Grosmannia clavigera kw1407]